MIDLTDSLQFKDILVVDIETGNIDLKENNFNPENCEICEIGIVNLNFDTGSIDTVFNKTCRENKQCNPKSWIFENTSLNYEEFIKSSLFHNIRDEIQEIFNNKPVTSWNNNFDFSVLEHHSRGLKIPMKFWDPMIELAPFMKLPRYFGIGYKFPRVEEALKYFNLGTEQKHRAIDDAKNEAEIILKAIKKWPALKKLEKNLDY